MSDENYKKLASDPALYPISFIERHGQQSIHWELESWQKRERSLCHDMLCILLSNLEPSQNLEEAMLKSLKRKATDDDSNIPPKRACFRSINDPQPSTSRCEEIEFSDNEESTNFMPDDDYSDDDYDPEKEMLQDAGATDYRYIVLEGLSTAIDVQNHFAKQWGMRGINKVFDIIDTNERKFIELKTTVRLNEVLVDYSKDINTCERTALITVDLNENLIDCHNKEDEMPGMSKAYNFILKRRTLMKILGLEDRIHDEVSVEKLLFKSDYIEKTIESMLEMFMGNINNDLDIGEINVSGFNIEPITPQLLFENLRKPLMEEHKEICSYKGKLTPFFYCRNTEVEEHDDLYASDTFMLKLLGNITLVHGKEELVKAVKELTNYWFDSNKASKHFGFIDTRDSKYKEQLSEELKDSLMIGKKGKIFNAETMDVFQPEREKISNKAYPKWFEKLYNMMSQQNLLGECDMGSIEEKSRLNMYEYIGDWLTKFYSIVGQKNVGGFMDQIGNFYSRISGTYNTTIGNRTTHSMIACIPIKMNIISNGIQKRFISGIAIRGPHHTRSATDKSNLLIIEEIEGINSIPENFYSKMTIFKNEEKYFIVRKTAIKKIDGIHLTFIKNSLFIASNMIGDIIMRHQKFISEDAFKALCASHITNEHSRSFFVDRVIDACLMAVIGNSRDEGYMSMFRKMLMVLLNERRQQHSFTFDVRGMCEKMNECLIDNPFSMFIHNSLL